MGEFRLLCETLETIGRTRGASAKTRLFAGYLAGFREQEDQAAAGLALKLAVRFAGEGAFGATDMDAAADRASGGAAGGGRDSDGASRRKAGVGSRTIAMAASDFCGIDHDLVFRACRTATGSGSEAIYLLMSNLPEVRNRQTPRPLRLEEVDWFFGALSRTRDRAGKERLLGEAWSQMTPLEVKFMIRMLSGGSLRIGFEAKSVLQAVGAALGCDAESLRFAHMVTGSLERMAGMAWDGTLNQARFSLFRPVSFMLATPIDESALDGLPFDELSVEEKFDGIRCQIHASGDRIELYSRDLNNITPSFPDVVVDLAAKNLPEVVLDGELVAMLEGRILPFQSLQRRLGVQTPAQALLEEVPVGFIAYDLLYSEGRDQMGLELGRRRELLETYGRRHRIFVARQHAVSDRAGVESLFEMALLGGNEGLMIKRSDSRYDYGQRRQAWLKLKRPGGSLDTVILYAHAGSGKRGGTWSDFTLGVSVRDDERYEEAFVPIGKAYGGYTDAELRELNRRLRPLVKERFGPTVSVEPALVVELEFDGIQENRRTKAGFSLRFPRFKAIRWDLGPGDVDTLRDVERQVGERSLSRGKIPDRLKPGSFIDWDRSDT